MTYFNIVVDYFQHWVKVCCIVCILTNFPRYNYFKNAEIRILIFGYEASITSQILDYEVKNDRIPIFKYCVLIYFLKETLCYSVSVLFLTLKEIILFGNKIHNLEKHSGRNSNEHNQTQSAQWKPLTLIMWHKRPSISSTQINSIDRKTETGSYVKVQTKDNNTFKKGFNNRIFSKMFSLIPPFFYIDSFGMRQKHVILCKETSISSSSIKVYHMSEIQNHCS